MPLQREILTLELTKLFDNSHPLFKGYPDTLQQGAKNFSEAISTYGKTIIPTSKTQDPARVAMENILATMKTGGVTQLPILLQAFTVWSTTLAGGMVSEIISSTPPVGVPLLSPFMVTTYFSNNAAAKIASDWASAIDLWVKTGTWTNITTTITSNWS